MLPLCAQKLRERPEAARQSSELRRTHPRHRLCQIRSTADLIWPMQVCSWCVREHQANAKLTAPLDNSPHQLLHIGGVAAPSTTGSHRRGIVELQQDGSAPELLAKHGDDSPCAQQLAKVDWSPALSMSER